MRKTGDWNKIISTLSNMQRTAEVETEKEMMKVAYSIKKSMVTGITSKRFNLAPNAPRTIKQKKSSTPLVDDGDLVGSIDVHKLDDNKALIGVSRHKLDDEGNSIANIFAINTYGVDKVLRNGRRLRIPARDAITPALRENKELFKASARKVIEKIFRNG